jgi:hypothetical protein
MYILTFIIWNKKLIYKTHTCIRILFTDCYHGNQLKIGAKKLKIKNKLSINNYIYIFMHFHLPTDVLLLNRIKTGSVVQIMSCHIERIFYSRKFNAWRVNESRLSRLRKLKRSATQLIRPSQFHFNKRFLGLKIFWFLQQKMLF